MSKATVELYLRVIDDASLMKDLGPLTHHISNYVDAEKMLKFLIHEGCTGRVLLQVWRQRFKGSLLETARWIIKEANHAREVSAIIVGEHFKV